MHAKGNTPEYIQQETSRESAQKKQQEINTSAAVEAKLTFYIVSNKKVTRNRYKSCRRSQTDFLIQF